MVEKIIVNPSDIRGYGNIVNSHDLDSYDVHEGVVSKVKEQVNGVLSSVYTVAHSNFGFIFGLDQGNKHLYIQTEEADTLTLGFDSVNKQLYVVNDTEETVSLGFDNVNNQLYIQIGE